MLEAGEWDFHWSSILRQHVFKVFCSLVLEWLDAVRLKNNKSVLNLVTDCKGVTFEPRSKEWTLRASDIPKTSRTTEISILKTCFNQGIKILIFYLEAFMWLFICYINLKSLQQSILVDMTMNQTSATTVPVTTVNGNSHFILHNIRMKIN